MNKIMLVNKFKNWLTANASLKLMHSTDFAEYEISQLLKTEAPGNTLYEDGNIFVGEYDYTYLLSKTQSEDRKAHQFSFTAIGIGSKENITEDDYELADYTEHTYIIK